MTDINNLIETCAETTKSKGFDLTAHATQIALIAIEVAEALEGVTASGNPTTDYFIRNLEGISEFYEGYRKRAKDYADHSTLREDNNVLEELADIVIRVFSYVGGNNQGGEFVQQLVAKMQTNKERAHKHGKSF